MIFFPHSIKVHKSNPYEIIPILFYIQEVPWEKYYIYTRSGVLKAEVTAGKVHGHYKPLLPHMKPEKAAKILSQLCSGTNMNQTKWVTNIHITRQLGRAGLRRKVPGTWPLLKPHIFSQSPQIHRPTLPSQNHKLQSHKEWCSPHLLKENNQWNIDQDYTVHFLGCAQFWTL